MAASSPYQGNDYQAVSNYRPYQLPVNDIFKGLSAVDQFWKIGAARVKQVYDNALNLKLSIQGNKDIRDQFMKDADKQIRQLSTMNLADPSVQRQGFGIFKPLLQDEGVISDDAATRHIEDVQQEISKSRQVSNGKYYSPNNAMYALDGVYEFRNSKDRMAGKQYLQNAKQYEPYYDFSGEMNNILKNCKPEEYSKDVESGMNIVTYSSKALSSVRLSGCVSAGLSDKAKRQLSIDGYTTYKNNPGALRDAYLPTIENSKAQMDEENASYTAILTNKDKLSSLNDDQLRKLGLTKDTVKQITPAMLQSFQEKIKDNQLRISNIDKTIGQLRMGDFSSITGDNLEPVASMVYSKGYADNYAAAFSYNTPPSTKIKANPTQLLIYRERAQDSRQEDEQGFQLQLKQMEIDVQRQLQLLKNSAIKGKKGTGTLTAEDFINAASINPAFEKDVSTIGSYDKITEERNKLNGQKKELDDYYLPQLRGMGMAPDVISEEDFRTSNQKFRNWYDNYTKTLPTPDPNWSIIKDYEGKMSRYKVQEDLLRNNQDEIDKQAVSELPNPAQGLLQGLATKPKVNVSFYTGPRSSPVVISKSPLDIINDINNGTASLLVTNSAFGGKTLRYTVDGKQYELDTTRIGHNEQVKNLLSDVHKYFSQSNDYDNKLEAKKNEIAKTRTIVQKEGYSFPELNDKENSLKLRIIQSIGLNNPNDITIGQIDGRGNVEVFLHPDNSNNPEYEANDIMENIKRTYGDHYTPLQGNKYHFSIGGFNEVNFFNSAETQTSELMLPYIRGIEKNVTNNHPQSTGLLRSSVPNKMYGMDVTTSSTPGAYQYKVHDEDGRILGIYADRIKALQIMNAALEGRFNENKITTK